MWITMQRLLNLQGKTVHPTPHVGPYQSPAKRELQTAEQSSTQHSHYAPQRHQADIMPNLD
jgi:hypothetical protein